MIAGYCSYMELKSGALELEDVALMHDAMAVNAENERRYRAAWERQQ